MHHHVQLLLLLLIILLLKNHLLLLPLHLIMYTYIHNIIHSTSNMHMSIHPMYPSHHLISHTSYYSYNQILSTHSPITIIKISFSQELIYLHFSLYMPYTLYSLYFMHFLFHYHHSPMYLLILPLISLKPPQVNLMFYSSFLFLYIPQVIILIILHQFILLISFNPL